MKIEDVIKEAQKLKPGSKSQVPTLIHVLIGLHSTYTGDDDCYVLKSFR